MTAGSSDHVVFETRQQVMRCLHCGAFERLWLPMPLGRMVERSEAFRRAHVACPPSGGDGAAPADRA